jgi:hypothetical protein
MAFNVTPQIGADLTNTVLGTDLTSGARTVPFNLGNRSSARTASLRLRQGQRLHHGLHGCLHGERRHVPGDGLRWLLHLSGNGDGDWRLRLVLQGFGLIG